MLAVTIIVFVGLLLILVLVHEWGHFFAAKRAGCRVEEFGFGFPPRLFSINFRGTRYSFNALPIGGFVKIEGEDMDEVTPSPTSFASKSAGWRAIILSAGVAMNVLLAVVLLSIQGVVGVPTLIDETTESTVTDQLTYVLEVTPNSPAAEAGLRPYDRIVNIEALPQPNIASVQKIVQEHAGTPITLTIDRQGHKETVTLTPRVNPPENEGPLGVSLAATGLQRVPWWQAPWHGLTRTGTMLTSILAQFGVILKQLITTGTTPSGLTGPVGIAVYTGEVTQLGVSYVLEFAALISLNLAIINILPIPALDGGRILFVGLEKLRGKRVAGKLERMSHTIGFALLIALMLLITFQDIKRFF